MSDNKPDYSKDAIPAGTIVVTRGYEDKMYDLEDMQFMREMEPGQLFRAVARYYGKTKEDYKTAWPKLKTPLGEVSQAWRMIEAKLHEEKTDFDRLALVCAQLGEEVPSLDIETESEE